MQSSNYIICLEEIQTLTKNIRQFSRESRSKRKPIYLIVEIHSSLKLNFIVCFQLILSVYIAYSRTNSKKII